MFHDLRRGAMMDGSCVKRLGTAIEVVVASDGMTVEL